MTARPYILSETNWKTIKDQTYDLAILPWGATEAHNFHLPYGTDNFESEFIANESARIAWEKGAKLMVLPTIPFGVNTGQLNIKFVINMNPSTQKAVLSDIVESLCNQGVNKLIILNGHGGNNFKQMIREINGTNKDILICTMDWYNNIVDAKDYFDEPGDHAGEMETSIMQKIMPDLVLPLSEAGDGETKKFKLKGLQNKIAWTQREWTRISQDTGVGDPSKASKEKGEKFLKAITEKIADFLIEFATCDIDDIYE